MSSSPRQRNGSDDWFAVHAHLPHTRHTQFLCDVVRPALREHGLTHGSFFLRYWQGGPHLRIRLRRSGPSPEALQAFVRELRSRMPEFDDRDRQEYLRAVAMQEELARLEREAVMPGRRLGEVVEAPYSPEYAKYGGRFGVTIAETVFCGTSRHVLDLLAANHEHAGTDRPPVGEALGITAMFLAGAGLGPRQAGAFLERYESWWEKYSSPEHRRTWPEAYERVSGRIGDLCGRAWSHPSPADPVFAIAAEAAASARRGAQRPIEDLRLGTTPFLGCLSNYIHTTNNRLGLVPAGEGFVARLLRTALAEFADGAGTEAGHDG